jgi:hypothetical protein
MDNEMKHLFTIDDVIINGERNLVLFKNFNKELKKLFAKKCSKIDGLNPLPGQEDYILLLEIAWRLPEEQKIIQVNIATEGVNKNYYCFLLRNPDNDRLIGEVHYYITAKKKRKMEFLPDIHFFSSTSSSGSISSNGTLVEDSDSENSDDSDSSATSRFSSRSRKSSNKSSEEEKGVPVTKQKSMEEVDGGGQMMKKRKTRRKRNQKGFFKLFV